MDYKPGAIVAILKADLIGTIVKRRLPNEDIYLVHVDAEDRYYGAEHLELIPDREPSFPLRRDSKEWCEELVYLSQLVIGQNVDVAELALQPEVQASLEKLGIMVLKP